MNAIHQVFRRQLSHFIKTNDGIVATCHWSKSHVWTINIEKREIYGCNYLYSFESKFESKLWNL